jgi:pyruvate,water dikinase
MAQLEEDYYQQKPLDMALIEAQYAQFADAVGSMVDCLNRFHPTRYKNLKTYHQKLNAYVRYVLSPEPTPPRPPFVLKLMEAASEDMAMTGSKAANLRILGHELDLPIPSGFVMTTRATQTFMAANDLRRSVDRRLAKIDINNTTMLNAISAELQQLIMEAEIPDAIVHDMLAAFEAMAQQAEEPLRVAVRSSAVGEDTHSSFAGQFLSVLNVEAPQLFDAYKAVLASKYRPRAIYYRINYGLTDLETPMAVLALKMVDANSSGVMYTHDPTRADSEAVQIHATWGLGELLVSGEITPDVITVSKTDPPAILKQSIGRKERKMVAADGSQTAVVAVDPEHQNQSALAEAVVHRLAQWGKQIEDRFQSPQDIEWCQDQSGSLFILQTRPLKTEALRLSEAPVCDFSDLSSELLFTSGQTASGGIGAGTVFLARSENELSDIPHDAVLVASHASPRFSKVLNRLSAVITDHGSTAGHFASVAREFGVPVIVATGDATQRISAGTEVTVDANNRAVYGGILSQMTESACARPNLIIGSPYMRKLRYMMEFITPLRLMDPQAPEFTPDGCRSMHDIIRFAHEKAVEEMFQVGERRLRNVSGAKKLHLDIPMLFYVLDVGGGLQPAARRKKEITLQDVNSRPMKAILQGLGHPGIQWGDFSHFDWAAYDKIVMSGGIISAEDAMFASHALVAREYANLNLRFGYHFVILDTVCAESAEDNYILMRFAGGGADQYQRGLRARFLSRILEQLKFEVQTTGDLVNAQMRDVDRQKLVERLDGVGRLLGATRLMDMYLKDEGQIDTFVADFAAGRYHFATVEEKALPNQP